MDHDDLPVGRILTRREVIRLLGAAGAVLVGCKPADPPAPAASVPAGTVAEGVPACVVKPELTVGPYYLDDQIVRADIRSEPSTGAVSEGVPLDLTFHVSEIGGGGACAPVAGAIVDVWQCDALGVYSGVRDVGQGFDTGGQKFLRGYQVTDRNGTARFTTIYPGWYTGRTVHIHFKIRKPESAAAAYEFTSQLFFDEALTDQVHARPPYAARGRRDRTNAEDGIYRSTGGELLLALSPANTGYAARFDIGLDLTNADVGRPDRMNRRGPGRRPPPPPSEDHPFGPAP